MSRTLKALSLLLSYPTEELKAGAGELRTAITEERALKPRTRYALDPLFEAFARDELIDLQGRYVDLFDRTRSLSLHLFEHVHGESRERGQAMIDLRETYLGQGFRMTPEELPDYLPAFLEFASLLPPREAREMLAQPAHVFHALFERLAKRGTPYAAVLQALIELSGGRVDPEALEDLRRQPDPSADDFVAVDAAWEEAPVKFGPETPEPTGFVAKLRAWKRPADRPPAGS
ncbi:nitrate reductase molybdenum cofactor assembly chaperone [Phenylobacterium sp.]|mgnify:CR=1 FL=1|uniref:nitrate reductase molybdenum cofactor assembly chaperone n=1 Tax=Phenylobacterium sp. TaxID=1871053 RepID=UPI002FE187B0